MKLGKIFLYIYLACVTAACAVFGVLYFLEVPSPFADKTLSYEEARTLVNKAYSAQIPVGPRETSSNSLEEEDYMQYYFEENETVTAYVEAYKIYTKVLKIMFDESLTIDTWFKDSRFDEYDSYFKYYIDGQSVCIQEASNADQVNTSYFPHGIMFRITKTGTKTWEAEMLARVMTTVGEMDGGCSISGVTFKAENDNVIYSYSNYGVAFDIPNTVINKIEDTTLLNSCGIYKCNLKTHKLLDRTNDKASLLTDDEKIKITNDLIVKTNKYCPVRTATDFPTNVLSSDIYARATA